MTTYAYQVGQFVGDNQIIALPTGSGANGAKYQLQRPDTTTFFDFLSPQQFDAQDVNVTLDGVNINDTYPFPVKIIGTVSTTSSGGGSTSSGLPTYSNSAITQASTTATSSSILATNANRKSYKIMNDASSSGGVYIAEASTASLALYTAFVQPGELYEPQSITLGPLSGICASGSTAVLRITEGS